MEVLRKKERERERKSKKIRAAFESSDPTQGGSGQAVQNRDEILLKSEAKTECEASNGVGI